MSSRIVPQTRGSEEGLPSSAQALAAYCGPSLAMRLLSASNSAGFSSDSGGRTGPAVWPTAVAPAFTMDTA